MEKQNRRGERTKIPNLKFNIQAMAMVAEEAGCYCISSMTPRTEICTDEKHTLILTHHKGFLMIRNKDLPMLIEELEFLHERNERLGIVPLSERKT